MQANRQTVRQTDRKATDVKPSRGDRMSRPVNRHARRIIQDDR